jgi:hypothetical protein
MSCAPRVHRAIDAARRRQALADWVACRRSRARSLLTLCAYDKAGNPVQSILAGRPEGEDLEGA